MQPTTCLLLFAHHRFPDREPGTRVFAMGALKNLHFFLQITSKVNQLGNQEGMHS